jgi:hypothetical protein
MLGLLSLFKAGPASLASEATMMSAAVRERRGRNWSEDDVNLLRSMAAAGKSMTLITVKLNRPMSVIKARAQELVIHIAGTEIGMRKRRNV